MINNNIDLIKMVYLDYYRVNFEYIDFEIYNKINTITINIVLPESTRECPYCNSTKSIHIHSRLSKTIYHPVIANRNCIIKLTYRKYHCNTCGRNYNQKNILCNDNKSITLVGDVNILNELRNFKTTFADVSKKYYIAYTTVLRCFDEIYTKNISKTKYAFVIFNPITSTILDVLNARLKNVLEDYFANIPLKERLIVKYINIDMWDTYLKVGEKFFPNATICIDSFHVIKHLNNAMNEIKKKFQKRFASTKKTDKKGYYWLLKYFHYFLTKDFDKIKYERKSKSKFSYLWTKHDVLNAILSIDKDLKEAYYLKEDYREFNLCEDYNSALNKIDDFIDSFKKSKFEEFRQFGRLLQT